MTLSSNLSLDHRIRDSVLATYQRLQNTGDLLPNQRLQEYCALFRSRFGPERLMELEGEALLGTMHSHSEDSLVYWLEFKNCA